MSTGSRSTPYSVVLGRDNRGVKSVYRDGLNRFDEILDENISLPGAISQIYGAVTSFVT